MKHMTENQIERRYYILERIIGEKRCNYSINLDNAIIDIRKNVTMEGIYTDSLKVAKNWIKKDMKGK